jgi:hypothetical protein
MLDFESRWGYLNPLYSTRVFNAPEARCNIYVTFEPLFFHAAATQLAGRTRLPPRRRGPNKREGNAQP